MSRKLQTKKSVPKTKVEERKEKARWQRILRVYGLTKEDYDSLNTGSCPVCVREFNDDVRPVVDHDHKTGVVRGILCFYCNHRVVGRHRDGMVLLRAGEYLNRPSTGYIVPKKKPKKRRKKV